MAKDEKITGYDLSRDWFNWCFENPEKITPTHTAMYFFIIEHCNRLGWKEKFGLPMEMTKDAIGVKNYKTYSNTLNDLIEWGFIVLIQKSKNQYSSCIIAISKITKAYTKALDEAMLKHNQKQGQSTVCIDKPITTEQDKPITDAPKTWREDYEIFLNELRSSFQSIINDKIWIKEKERFHPNVDIELSIEKVCKEYWATDVGWKKKKGIKSTKTIDWKATFTNSLNQKQNLVYKQTKQKQANEQPEPTYYKPIIFDKG